MSSDAANPGSSRRWRFSAMTISAQLFGVGFISVVVSMLAGGFLLHQTNALSMQTTRLYAQQQAVDAALRDVKVEAAWSRATCTCWGWASRPRLRRS